jgi:uncharacterized RDD family membrane protein YckC
MALAHQPAADPTAVMGRRVVAFLIDAALVLVPTIVLLTSSFEYLDTDELDRSPEQFCDAYLEEVGDLCLDLDDVDGRVYFSEGVDAEATWVLWGGPFVLHVLLQGVAGWTPGKLVAGIRTVREDGQRVGVPRAFLRWLLWIVDGFPYVAPLLGGIVALTTQGHRRVGDMAASTFVVRSSAAGTPIVVPGMTPASPTSVPYTPMAPPAPAGRSWAPDPAPTAPGATGSGWAAPDVGTAEGAPAGAAAGAGAATPGPQWDAARGTYIQWDPVQRTWLQWDETARAWSQIPGQ